MKKIGKILSVVISFVLINTNNSFATSSYEAEGSRIGDIVPFVIGAILIVGVLFLAYKMDNSAEGTINIKRKKAKKANKQQDISEKQEAQIYAEENKTDIPYEEDYGQTYEKDDIDENGLYEDTEYEEDDISLFNSENTQESSFDDIDDDISYELDNDEEYEDDFVEDESFDYSEPVEGLDDKIESLDDLENSEEYQEPVQEEKQEAEEFMNEINKYKEAVELEENEFSGFTTQNSIESVANEELPVQEEKHVRKYTKKKVDDKDSELEADEEPLYNPDDQFVELSSGQMDINFLDQMEQNLKESQKERLKKTEKTTKRGRKPKNEED